METASAVSEVEDIYILEIYEPGSTQDTLVTYKSSKPFPAMHRGEVLRPLGRGEQSPGTALMIRHVLYMTWDFAGPTKIKTCIFTSKVSDNPHDWDRALLDAI